MEHYWKLCPVWFIRGTTHTLVEVIHSYNREHRHNLKVDNEQGFYSFLWPLTIPGDEDIPTDFDDMLTLQEQGFDTAIRLSRLLEEYMDFDELN